jgi:MFS family permease
VSTDSVVAAESQSQRMTSDEWRASLFLALLYALRMLGLFLILPVFSVHAAQLPGGSDPVQVGLVLGIYSLTQGLLQLPFGMASDRWGRKPVIVFGLLVFALGSWVAAGASDVAGTIIGRAIQGMGAISAAVTACIADHTRDSQRTKAMAMVGVSIGLMFAISLVLAPGLYAAVGMRGLFELIGVLALLGIAVVVWGVPSLKTAVRHDAERRTSFRAVAFDADLARLNFGIFVLHAVQMAMFVVLPTWLVQRAQMPVAQHWQVYLPVVVVSFLLMIPPLGWAERRGHLRVVFLGSIVLVWVAQLGYALQPYGALALGGCLLVFFTAFNVLEASLPSLVSRLAPPDVKGTALGIYNTTQALGLFVGGGLGGWVVCGVCRAACNVVVGGSASAALARGPAARALGRSA